MIIDSSALVAIILNEPEERSFIKAIFGARQRQMSAASYFEVALRLDTVQDGPDPALDATIELLGIEIVDFTVDHSRAARVAHSEFGRARHAANLNFGDCMTYALAKLSGKPLLFKGNDFGKTDLELVDVEGKKD